MVKKTLSRLNDEEFAYTVADADLPSDYTGPENISAAEVIQEMYMEPLGLSGAALAKAIGVAPSTVNRMLNGDTSLTPELAVRICAVVGGSPAVLMRIEGDYRLAIAQLEVDTSKLKSLITA